MPPGLGQPSPMGERPTHLTSVPPDRMKMTTGELVQLLWARITADGLLDEQEMEEIGTFFKSVQEFAAAQQEGQQQEAEGEGGEGLESQQPNGQTSDYQSGQGADISSQVYG